MKEPIDPRCYYCQKKMYQDEQIVVTFSKGEISRNFHASCGLRAIQESFKDGR